MSERHEIIVPSGLLPDADLTAKLAAAEAERDELQRALNTERFYVGDEPKLRAKLAKATVALERIVAHGTGGSERIARQALQEQSDE